MVPHISAILGSIAVALSIAVSPVGATCIRGLGWATNNQYGSIIGHTPLIKWYHRQYNQCFCSQRSV